MKIFVAIIVFASFLPVPAAHADAWGEFMARCVNTLRLGEPVDLSGLTRMEAPLEGERDTYVDAFHQTKYWVLYSEETAEDAPSCMVMSSIGLEESQASYEAWVSRQKEAGYYEALPTGERLTLWIADMKGFVWRPSADFPAVIHLISERDREWDGEDITVFGFMIIGPVDY